MRRLTVAMVLVMGLVGILSPDGHPVTGRIGAVSSAWAAEDPCEAAGRLYNETIPMDEASREKELLEQALALQCRDALVLFCIHNNLGDALERLGRREEALRHYAEAYVLFPYDDVVRKNLLRLSEDLDEATAKRLVAVNRVQEAKEIISKLDVAAHLRRLRGWRKIATEWAHPQKPPASAPAQSEPPSQAAAETLPPPPQGLSWLPTVIIHFDFDSDELRPESEAQLKELAEALKSPSLRGSRFRLEGHTCDIGSPDYNQRLSERRAMSVKNRLVSNGVDPAQLLVKGYGMTRPIMPNTEGTRHLNRRVQVVTVAAQVASARRSGARDPLRKDLERVAELIAQGDYDEAEAILKRLEAAVTEQTPGEDRARIAENRALIELHKGRL